MSIFKRISTVADLVEAYGPLCEELIRNTSQIAVDSERARVEALRPNSVLALKTEYPQLCEEITAEAKAEGQAAGVADELHRWRTIITKACEMGAMSFDSAVLGLLADGTKTVSDILLALNDLHKERRGRRLASFIEDAPEPASNTPEGQEINLWDQALAQAVAAHNAEVG